MADGVLGGVDPLQILNTAIWTLLAVFALFIVVQALAGKERPTTWKYGEVELSIRRWLPICALLALFAIFSRPALEAFSRWRAESSVPAREPDRLSIVIPEFGGPNGTEAAKTLKSMLQSALGSGVQIRTVPSLPDPPRYADANAGNNKLGWESFRCAARYDADVVVWGTYLPSTNMLDINYTAKSKQCFPSNCGKMASRYPTLHALDDARNQNSSLATTLTGSVLTALEMAITSNGESAGPAACLADPETARTYAAKARSLIEGRPLGLDPERLSDAAGLAALFYRKAFEHSKNVADLNRGISLLADVSSRYPKYASRSAGLHAGLLTDKGEVSKDQREVLRLAQRIESLLPVADARDRANMRMAAAGLVEKALYMGATAEILGRVEAYHLAALRNGSLPAADRLHHLIRITGAHTEYFTAAPGLERHTPAVRYAKQAFKTLRGTPGLEKQISGDDRCTLAWSDLVLASPHQTLDPLIGAYHRARGLLDEDRVNWSNGHCAMAFHRLSDNLVRLSKQAEGTGPVELLRLGVHFERIVLSRDKTHARHDNEFYLAFAAVELAKVSRTEADRRDALRLLRQAERDAITQKDPLPPESVAKLVAEIG